MILWIGKKIYSLPYRAALDTKTHEFKCKLINRCLVTNTFLCRIGIITSPACSLCGESDESLEHLFLSCQVLGSEVIKWLVDHKFKIENLSGKDILFDVIECGDEIIVNRILLLAKQYLYSCRHYSTSIRVLNSKIDTSITVFPLFSLHKALILNLQPRVLG